MTQFRFHHLGVAVPEITRALPAYAETFSYNLISGPFDDPAQEATVCFLGNGADPMVIELVSPLGPDSKVRRILAHGGGAYHLCFEVDALEAAMHNLVAKRWIVLSGPTPAVAFGGRRIAWLYGPIRQLIELLEKAAPA